MELRHLRYFVAVAEELHFRRAAERLYIAQPGLSQQISQLERELGVKLLHRTSRSVELTSAGKRFLEEARQVVYHADRAAAVARQAARGEIGELQVGYIEQATHYILSALLPCFRSRHPTISLSLRLFALTPKIVQSLLRRSLDVGFGLAPVITPDVESAMLDREQLMIAMPQQHRLAGLDEVPLPELAGDSWNLWRRELNPHLHEVVSGFFREAGFVPDVQLQSLERDEIYLWVAAGLGVAMVPESTALATDPRGVVLRRLVKPTPYWDHVLMWRVNDANPVLQSFLAMARELAADGAYRPRSDTDRVTPRSR
jgi:DNA-binding transcriptional LysR family regulator